MCRAEEAASPLIDLRNAVVVVPADLNVQENKAIAMLAEEIAERTRLRLPVLHDWPADASTAVIGVAPASSKDFFRRFGQDGDDPSPRPAEGYRIRTIVEPNRAPVILVSGNDSRGVLYGVGRLLRTLHMGRDRLSLPGRLDIETAPAMRIRGHQIGYRPKTNSYDAWDLPQWEQYLRDLAVFGANSIELIPPRSDDDADSPHFPRPPLEMMIGVSQLAADYGLDVWIWYPAMELRYATDESIDAAVVEWGAVLAKLPRVDALFVPSGDPGDAPPAELMNMLAAQAEQLRRLHPDAELWISIQGFTQPQFDEMMALLRAEPAWLAGVVHGPQTRVSVAKLRELLPSRYAIRGYPDITHSMRCEYPVPDWDLAYALTEGREPINPRPIDQATIFWQYPEHAAGVIAYSEGCNDDVNKAIWSALCWDPEARPIDVLREYGRCFLGDQYADDFAQGLLALERNWRGPLLASEEVTQTLRRLQAMERAAAPAALRNWRFQQALYRAYYDAYIYHRLVEESAQEAAAMSALAAARTVGVDRALADAESALAQADAPSVHEGLRQRTAELAEALFQSIGMQLSVERYQAIAVGRGANLDEIDVPLNNRAWLSERFASIRRLNDPAAQLRAVEEIVNWTDPGPGGFYDDLGNPSQQPHVVVSVAYASDPGFLATPAVGFRSDPAWRRSWCTHVDGLYDTPIVMHYPRLDPAARYKLRVVYAGDVFDVKVRLAARCDDREIEIHPWLEKPRPPRPVEYAVPAAATAGGELTLQWRANADRGGAGRGCQIAEVWLLKQE
ncbi:MAG: hypothetical protein DCC67_02720 [Planctomycetota bacterium]|nr:MAG: hypothetical protein DCC67_02720 [Planctomycetota bacterium]